MLTHILNDKKLDQEFFEKKFKDPRQILSYKTIIYTIIALNPFIIFEALWNGHNDLLMGLLILVCLYFCFKEKLNLALIFFSLSVLAKYLSLALLPFVLILAFRKRFPWQGFLGSIALFLASWLYYQPFTSSTNKILNNVLLCHKSLQRTVNTIYKAILGEHMPAEVNLVFLGIFVLALLFLAYKFYQSSNKNLNIFFYSFLAMYLLIFVFSAKFHSWYLMMMLPFAVLLSPRLMMLLSISHMLSFTFLDQANAANFIVMTLIPSLIYFKFLRKQDY